MNASQRASLLAELKSKDLILFSVVPSDAGSKREAIAKIKTLLDRSTEAVVSVVVAK